MTMNDTWGYKKLDTDWKSTKTLVQNLIDIASKGGNYLLNVGPTGEGLIPEASVDRLEEIGLWMHFNGEAIYDTTASPFKHQLPWGRCTTKTHGRRTTLYFHVFDWPADGRLLIPGLKTQPHRAFLLASDTHPRLPIEATDDGIVISVPADLPHAISTTVVAEFNKPIEIAQTYLLPDADGSITLHAVDADLHGGNIQYEQGDGRNDIGFWTNPDDYADWRFKLAKPGSYEVTAEIAAPAPAAVEVSLGAKTLHAEAPQTASYREFKKVALGRANYSEGGVFTLGIHAVKEGWNPVNLRDIKLTPVSPE
jgi:alpha-L-fucosidase